MPETSREAVHKKPQSQNSSYVTPRERVYKVQTNLNSSNTDGSFTMANSNSFLSPYEILPIAPEKKYLRKFSYFIMEL